MAGQVHMSKNQVPSFGLRAALPVRSNEEDI
jgi:hypothetical protein